jgi:hypothetical protein
MLRAIPPVPQYAFMAWCSVKKSTGIILLLPFGMITRADEPQNFSG